MASIIDAYNDAVSENFSAIKILLYSIPIFVCAKMYVSGNTSGAYILGAIISFILLGVIACGINNIKKNKREILTFNIPYLLLTLVKLLLGVIPVAALLGFGSYYIVSNITIPLDLPHIQTIFKYIIYGLAFAISFTSFISFSRKLNILEAYNVKIMYEYSTDITIMIFFLIIQLAIINTLVVGFIYYAFTCFKVPATNPLFIFICSIIFIINISMISNYFAQASYEIIKEKDSEYVDKYIVQLKPENEPDKGDKG